MVDIQLNWRPGIDAPKYYPICTFFGSFSTGKNEDNNSCSLAISGPENGGWGNSGLEMSTGDFVPQKLDIGWFSFAENKYFFGQFILPTDKMKTLFKEAFIRSNGNKAFYNSLITNMYPQGGIALWMSIGGVRTVEIAHFQAEETDYDWKKLYPSMLMEKEVFIKEVMDGIEGGKAYLTKHGISPEPFKTIYRTRYEYTITIDDVAHKDTIHIIAKFYNGEMDTMWGGGLTNNFFKTKALPKHLFFRWHKNGIVYFGEVYFKEQEIFEVFGEMYQTYSDTSYVLRLNPDYGTKKVTIVLISQEKKIKFKKYGKLGKSSINLNN
ncbi:DUF2931 family protein [Kriegella sp. EG-1]|nr:DUF2931 family protein [Flavobacteriaceae bacterium EG-1]